MNSMPHFVKTTLTALVSTLIGLEMEVAMAENSTELASLSGCRGLLQRRRAPILKS